MPEIAESAIGKPVHTLADRTRRIVWAPRVWYMRRREHHAEPFVRALLEQFEYRRSIYSFIAERQRNPDLIIDFDVRDDAVIFDVGAYLGQWSQRVLARSCAMVYAFEPNPTVQARLHQQLDAFPTATILDYGLGARAILEQL